jgi:3-deoxy-7-phosphoheptulonate synthase
MTLWHPASWQTKPCSQAVSYPDTGALSKVLHELASQPSLVTVTDVLALKKQLAEAAFGGGFLLQGGDCAELFAHNDHETTNKKLALFQLLKAQLAQQLHQPIICVGRIAGQYAKPRSYETETKNGVTLPSYRGDIINQHAFTPEARTPDPSRIRQGYQCAAHTMARIQSMGQQAIYTSHEALLLPYEQALTRQVQEGSWYNLSTHFPWCGMRTNQPDGAHIEYLRGIVNPIALKIGPDTSPETLIRLLDIVNPQNEPGRITLIHRLGASAIEKCLSLLIKAIKTEGRTVLWVSDPMHGNTTNTQAGIKTRSISMILSELQHAFEIHAAEGSYLGGVHLELTGDAVMECDDLLESDTVCLQPAQTTLVDPRLNQQQSLSVIQAIAKLANPDS